MEKHFNITICLMLPLLLSMIPFRLQDLRTAMGSSTALRKNMQEYNFIVKRVESTHMIYSKQENQYKRSVK